ncbi:MAG: hypothetical protein H6557_21190 [Lewinellaceae bacterium]|nr:hypothetical protein [Phaeodactylibacter sp.]MCB9039134.1 hypothetical protein [Lewinellaceae bacterium]
MHKKSKISSWEEFYQTQRSRNVKDHLIELSQRIVSDIKANQEIDDSAFCLAPKNFTVNVPRDQKRTVFVNVIFNVNSLKIETLFHGEKTEKARFIIKKGHVVNEFKLVRESDYTEELKTYIEGAFHVILHNEYDTLVEKFY